MKHADEESVDISKMSIWRFREYRRWLTLGTSHDFASAIKRFTFPMLTLMATGDPLLAGLVGTLGVASEAIAGLVGGVFRGPPSQTRSDDAGIICRCGMDSSDQPPPASWWRSWMSA